VVEGWEYDVSGEVEQVVGSPFEHVGLVGLGLLGGSLAMAVRAAWPSVRVSAFVRTPTPEARAVTDALVPEVADLAGCDLIVLATPVDAMVPAFMALAKTGTRAVVTDMGSTKRTVMAAAREAGLSNFVGGHPMAGAERPGLALARPDLFRGKAWLLVKGSANVEASARVEMFVGGVGAVPHWMDAETHDRTIAFVSHLPQMVAVALMNAADGAVGLGGRDAAGSAFAEMTRLASSPREMWTGVLTDNADYVREALIALLRELPEAEGDPGAWAREALARSGDARARWRGAPLR
jgi:prephenate dehydrogenase